MKKKCTLIFLTVVLTGTVRLAAQPGTWIQKKSLYNLVSGRKYAVAFSLYGKGYIGTGYSYGFGYDGASNNDLWQYDTLHNVWTQMASMPVVGRQSATAFAVHGKAYITGGDGTNGIVLKDLWEYDPLKNAWKRKADMPNTGLNAAHAFALHGKGYVGFGLDSVGYFQKGIWCYDPATDTWTRKKDFPAATVGESFALSNDSIAIAGLGVVTATGRSAGDIWLYDANADTWTQKNNFKGQPRFGEASFTANNTFYIIGGENNSYRFVTDGWKYDIAHDTWISTGDFPGQPRGGAVSFVIGRNAYMGTGYDATSNDKTLGDLWELDTKSLQWKERASLGGGPRDLAVSFGMNKLGIVATGEDGTRFKKDVWAYNALLNDWRKLPDLSYGKESATGFSIGYKMYIGLGLVDTSNNIINPVTKSKDFWVFDFLTQTWTQAADFGGGIRGAAASFVIDGKGYVGTGFADNGALTNDLWQYDPQTNTWTRKADFPGAKRSYAVAFAINGKGYIGLGSNATKNLKDMYAYDAVTNSWSAVAAFPGKARAYSTGVAAGGKGYAGLGVDNAGNFFQDWWQFDPQQNVWIQQKDFPYLRWGASALSTGNDIYVGMGVPYSGIIDTMFATNDWWQFVPDNTVEVSSEATITSLSPTVTIGPNPFKDKFQLKITGMMKDAFRVVIEDENGKIMEQRSVNANSIYSFGDNYAAGIYFIHVFNHAIELPAQRIMKL